jgi:hypothetical protein
VSRLKGRYGTGRPQIGRAACVTGNHLYEMPG